ncbi:hypothetical protein ACHAXR_002089 [Thalassiosira sp. AJA248-18]
MIPPIFLYVTTAAFALLSPSTNAFLAPSTSTKARSATSLPAFPPEFLDGILGGGSPDETLSPVVEAARQKFWFYFFAGSGAGGIGLAQLPSMFREVGVARDTAGTGSTLGGAALNAGPLVGIYYDSEISKDDVADAIQKAPTAEFISSRSTSLNYMASKGYIEQRDFVKEMEAKKCNPLASYALYDAISSGKGGVVSPVVYEDKLLEYREGSSAGDLASSFVGDLNGFLAVKVGAFFGLVFCLLVDVGFIANAGIAGFLS